VYGKQKTPLEPVLAYIVIMYGTPFFEVFKLLTLYQGNQKTGRIICVIPFHLVIKVER